METLSSDEYRRQFVKPVKNTLPAYLQPNTAGSGPKPAKWTSKPSDNEHEMQCTIVDDFRAAYPLYARLLIAIPNGAKLPYYRAKNGKVVSIQRMKLLKEGMVPGVPDLMLAVARGGYFGLFMENKIGNNKPEPHQKSMLELLSAQGYYCCVNYSEASAAKIFADYMSLPFTNTTR